MTEHVEPDGLMMEARALPPETSFAGAGKAASASWTGGWPNIPDTSGPPPVALQEPAHWIYDFDPASGQSRATFLGLVSFTEGGSGSAGVTSWNGETGAVVMQAADVIGVGGLVNPSAALTGTPTAPTASLGVSTTQIATTAFVAQALAALNNPAVSSFNGRVGAITLTTGDVTGAGGAPSASPAFTGNPTAPTPAVGNASGSLATTQFVSNALASGAVTSFNGRTGPVTFTLSDGQSVGLAPVASPTFTGSPAGPTANPGTATTQLATTAFVTNAVSAATAGVSSFNTRTGAVTLTLADVTGVGGAPLLSPVLTGTPEAPTPTAGDNSTKIATTAFVETALGGIAAGVTTFNGRAGTVTLQASDLTNVGGALLASPTFTGTPAAPTPPPLDNSTRLATTAFVEAALPAVPAASNAAPLMNGTAAPGSAAAYSRGDHVHPIDTSRAAATALANYLPLTGGAVTGPTTFSAAAPITASGGMTFNGGIANLTGLTGASGAQLTLFYNTTTAFLAFYLNGAIDDVIPYGYSGGNFFGMARCGLSNPTLQGYAVNSNGNSFYFALTSASDRRLKSAIAPAEKSGLDTINALTVYEFELDQPGVELASHWDFGLMADEVGEVIPPAYVPAPDLPGGYETLRDLPIVATLVKAVQELSAKCEALTARVAALEAAR